MSFLCDKTVGSLCSAFFSFGSIVLLELALLPSSLLQFFLHSISLCQTDSVSKTSRNACERLDFRRFFCSFHRQFCLEKLQPNPYHVVHRGDAMQHSLEAYFLVNFVMDAALIAVVARANECMRLRKVILCSFLAASYAILTETVSVQLRHPAVQVMLLALLALLLAGEPEIYRWGFIAFQLFGGAMILGGIGSLNPEPDRIPAVLLGAGMILLSVFMNMRRQRMLSWEVTVLVSLRGRTVSFPALIDTGNRLHEPLSGLPVLIAEASLLKALLAQQGEDSLPCRRVAFGVLGGSGNIRCFRPDMVLIRRGDRLVRAPDVWVAVYPGRIPGTSRALAPPSFAVIPGKLRF